MQHIGVCVRIVNRQDLQQMDTQLKQIGDLVGAMAAGNTAAALADTINVAEVAGVKVAWAVREVAMKRAID